MRELITFNHAFVSKSDDGFKGADCSVKSSAIMLAPVINVSPEFTIKKFTDLSAHVSGKLGSFLSVLRWINDKNGDEIRILQGLKYDG